MKRVSLRSLLILLSSLPVLCASIIVTVLSISTITSNMENEVYKKLHVAAEDLRKHISFFTYNN